MLGDKGSLIGLVPKTPAELRSSKGRARSAAAPDAVTSQLQNQ